MVNVGDLVVGQRSEGQEWIIGLVQERVGVQYDHETMLKALPGTIDWYQGFVDTDTVVVLEPAPYESIAEGKLVTFTINGDTASGRVHRYDNEKQFYELIVNVGRDGVEEQA